MLGNSIAFALHVATESTKHALKNISAPGKGKTGLAHADFSDEDAVVNACKDLATSKTARLKDMVVIQLRKYA